MRRVPIALAFALCAIAEMVVPTLGTSQERRAVVPGDVYRVRDVGEPRISPDGAWIAYTVTTSIWRYPGFTHVAHAINVAGNDRPAFLRRA